MKDNETVGRVPTSDSKTATDKPKTRTSGSTRGKANQLPPEGSAERKAMVLRGEIKE